MTADEIVREICRRTWSFGVSVLLSPADTVDADGYATSGYFCEENKALVVATGREEEKWLGVMIHEYCHLTQWAEGATVWKDDDNANRWDAWVQGKPCRNVRRYLAATRELEADCERRAIRLMKEMSAPIDLARYARQANAYIHFYNLIPDTRKWFASGKRPYDMPEVLALANPTLDKDFTKTPPKLRAALMKCI